MCVGDGTHHWRTPTDVCGANLTCIEYRFVGRLAGSFSISTIPKSKLYLHILCHSHSYHARSKAFFLLMKLSKRSCWWCKYFSTLNSVMLNICSVVVRFGQYPACSPGSSFPACLLVILTMAPSIT